MSDKLNLLADKLGIARYFSDAGMRKREYIVNDDGDFEVLSPEDVAIKDAYTDDLIKELQKRGYSVTKEGDKNGTENNGNLP